MKSAAGQPIAVKVRSTVTRASSRWTAYTMPRSTMLTGISGSWTSRSASMSSSGIDMRPAEPVKFLLQRSHHLGVARASRAPALQHVVPATGVVVVPSLGFCIEGAREWVVQDVVVTSLMGRHLDAHLVAERHDQGEPPLTELVVGLALQPVVELGRVGLDAVGQPEPLNREREHPVDRLLQLVAGHTAGLRHAPGPGSSVSEVEVLFQHHLVQSALPGAV